MIKGIVNGVEKDIVRIPMNGKNLAYDKIQNANINSSGKITTPQQGMDVSIAKIVIGKTYTVNGYVLSFYENEPVAGSVSYDSSRIVGTNGRPTTFTAPITGYVAFRVDGNDRDVPMCNEGTQILPYESYGYQEGWEVRKGDGTLIWGRNDTISVDSGTLPIKGYGVPLVSITPEGNSEQTGTPTPASPIDVTGCGDRTGNSFNTSTVEKGRIDNGVVGYASNTTELTITGNTIEFTTNYNYRGVCSGFIEIPDGVTDIAFSGKFIGRSGIGKKIVFYDTSKTWMNSDVIVGIDVPSITTSVPSGAKYVRLSFTAQTSGTASISNLMLNSGTAAKPYEPYGYKVALTANSTTTPIYLGQTPTTRRVKKLVLTGEENWSFNLAGTNTDRYAAPLDSGNINQQTGYCTHFPFYATGIGTDTELVGCYNNNLMLRVDKADITNATELKVWLAAQYANGTPVVIWYVLANEQTGIVNEPIMKIGTYADTLTVTDQDVTITPAVGNDTITVDTTLPPSKLSLTGHIKALPSF